MDPRDSVADDVALHLILPVGDVPLSKIIRAQQAFLDLIREVSRTVARSPGDPVQWVVSAAEQGSIDLSVTPLQTWGDLPPTAIPQMVRRVANGMAVLRARPERPPDFTDRALEKTKELAALLGDELPSLAVTNGHSATSLSPVLVAHVDTVLGDPTVVTGTVEGVLQSVSVRNERVFSIFDPLTDGRIECHFGYRIQVADIAQAMERRVAVHGDIRYRDTGEIAGVVAKELEVIPRDDELPTADEVKGILSR